MKHYCMILVAGLCASGLANTVLDTYPDWTGLYSVPGFTSSGETIIAPGSNLVSFEFGLAAGSANSTFDWAIYNWAPIGPSGVPIYQSGSNAWNANPADYTFNNLNISLTSGAAYIFVMDFQEATPSFGNKYNVVQNAYPGSQAWVLNNGQWATIPGFSQTFRAEFSDVVPEPASLLALASAVPLLLRRRKKVC